MGLVHADLGTFDIMLLFDIPVDDVLRAASNSSPCLCGSNLRLDDLVSENSEVVEVYIPRLSLWPNHRPSPFSED